MKSSIITNDKILTVRITGKSMYPNFKNGDIVLIKVLPIYEVNDVVVVKCKIHFIIHRIIKINNILDNRYYLTKGDNNPNIDRWYSIESIVGKVIQKNNQ